MNRNLMWRLGAVAAVVLLSVVFLTPSLAGGLPAWWRSVLPDDQIRLGLDLQGGIHMVLEVDVDKAVENSADLMMEQLKRELRADEIATRDWKRVGRGFSFELVSRSRVDDVRKRITDDYPNLETLSEDGARFELALVEPEVEGIRQFAVDQALETIRNRVDEFGVSEPTIQRTGENGILVQLPGVQDPERAKRLIGRTAQLEFRLLDEGGAGKEAPITMKGDELDPVTGRASEITYQVEPTVLMTGEVIADARHRPGQFGEPPFVEMTLNGRGAQIFERITGESVGRRLAIVLDGRVQSAPVIRERIGGGRAVITGNFNLDEARDLAIVLRAGALPAPVTIAEERTVGPSLGRDSIRAGMRSFALGAALVAVFMLLYYRLAGLIADLGLLINVVVLLAILAAFQATLTLPGIAGIVLTLGMAVDANVLINERIREELRRGQTPHTALEAGYSRALPAILDSNITTFLAGLVLFQFGSGPIKGFALTLCIGIASTIFSAVFASRALHDFTLAARRGTALSI